MYFNIIDTPRGCGNETQGIIFLFMLSRKIGDISFVIFMKGGHNESEIFCYWNDLFCLLCSC